MKDANESSTEADFRMWVDTVSRGNTFGRSGAVIKDGRQVVKTVTLSMYGDPQNGEISKRELRFRTYIKRRNSMLDFDEPDPKTTWWCENEEIERLLAFLHSKIARSGRYQVVDTDSPGAALLDLLRRRNVDTQFLVEGLVQHSNLKQVVDLLASSSTGMSAVESVVVARRRELVKRLRRLIDRREATETQVRHLIGNAYWLFGGRYTGVADRRNLMPLDEHDIPLLGADGTLHIVELKGPVIPGLVVRHRNHWIAGTEVHKATSQAMNYIRQFDELGAGVSKNYENELGQSYDMRRVFATVVIGNTCHVTQANHSTIHQTLRSYNAHLSRVEVVTYDQLVDSADRALVFEEDTSQQSSTRHEIPEIGSAESPQDDPWDDDEPPF